MPKLTQLGMTDVASRERNYFFWVAGILSFLGVAAYVVLRNALFVSEGMLKPDFGVIHKAYNFNLSELPWTLVGLGLCFFAFGLFRPRIRKSAMGLCVLYLFFAADLCLLRHYVSEVEPQRLIVRQVRIETPKLSVPVRILHLADVQAGAITEYEQSIFERINELQPDLILFTGDFLQPVAPATFESEWPKLLELFRSTSPRLGIFAVYGDTEYSPGLKFYRLRGQDMEPIEMLSSASRTLDTGGGLIDLYGLNLFRSKETQWVKRSTEDWLAKSDPNAFHILMGHAPDYAMVVREEPIDLCLAGHTHGGQVCLPWYGPLVIDSEVPREWASGFRRIGVPYLNVSAGAGCNRFEGLPPIRFLCPTEMTLIELVPMKGIR